MKTYLKILAAVVSVAVLWLGYRLLYPRKELVSFETLTIDGGEIASESFVQLRDRLVQSTAEKKTFVVKTSAGGDGFAALAIGILLHRHNWDVEVVDICPSSCAIYIFPAGKTKYLHPQSLLLFHGGPHQENMLEQIEMLEQELAKNGQPVDTLTFGRKNKEGIIRYTANRSVADEEVLKFLSITPASSPSEKWAALRRASDQFHQELGINPLIATYGQIGEYEALYKSDKYGGFIYRLDSLHKFGVRNIELTEGEWHPERHPDYKDVYEVTYP